MNYLPTVDLFISIRMNLLIKIPIPINYIIIICMQRFSGICENRRASSHQILTGKTDSPETTLQI